MNKVLSGMMVAAALTGCMTAETQKCDCLCGQCACCDAGPACTPEEAAEGFVPLFDGKTLAGWEAPKNGCYHVAKGGILAYRPDLGSGGMWTEKSYRDFDLRYDFRLTCDCNNGLGVRVPKGKGTYDGGFEIQMIDDEGSMYKDVFPQLGLYHRAYQRHGAVYGVVPPKVQENGKSYLKPVGQWNSQRVKMVGHHLEVWLNGEKIQDCDLSKYPIDGSSMDHAKHPGIRSLEGRFGWLSHGYPCWWKNIRIKEL